MIRTIALLVVFVTTAAHAQPETGGQIVRPATPSNLVPWSPPSATAESVPARAPLTDASRAHVDDRFHAAAAHYVHARDRQAVEELFQGLEIDPDHEPSRQLLEKIMQRQQQEQEQQQEEQQQDREDNQGDSQQQEQQRAATPTPAENDEDPNRGDPNQATPTPAEGQQQPEYAEREMSEEEAEALLEQLEREEAQRRRETREEQRPAQYRVEKDW